LDEFYHNPVVEIDNSVLTKEYYDLVKEASIVVKKELDNLPQEGIMVNTNDIWKYEYYLTKIANIIVPFLEEKRFGCHLYVDKVYIYRTLKLKERQSSYLWHYDNNPSEIVKNIIYLNKVTNKNSPFEYLANKKGNGILANPTRTGPNNWNPAPNNSRITNMELFELSKKGYEGRKITGDLGTTYSFNNNAIHRVNPIIEGYRDVINIRVKPTIDKKKEFINRKWTSGHEKSGAVSPYPDVF
jgi:hypothetical protein